MPRNPGFKSRAGSTLALLRFPFSFFLLPVYLAALAQSELIDFRRALLAFLLIHLFLYPASNGFNSFYDRDRGPIGGLARPPEADKSLLFTSLFLDALALLIGGLLFGALFTLGLLAYGTASKLYSWDRTRLKARPVIGWLMTGLGQGGLTFMLVVATVDPRGLPALDSLALFQAGAISLLLLGIFPLTQVYQHEEDASRGDLTISRWMGVRGTFLLSGAFLGAGLSLLGYFLLRRSGPLWFLAFAFAQLPSLIFFCLWLRRVFRDAGEANFGAAMRMNLIASGLLNAFFIAYLAFERAARFS